MMIVQPVTPELRRWIVEQSLAATVGHVGSALSIAEIMAALWEGVMRQPGTQADGRDRFILSKGHAALALYGALRWKGLLDEDGFRKWVDPGRNRQQPAILQLLRPQSRAFLHSAWGSFAAEQVAEEAASLAHGTTRLYGDFARNIDDDVACERRELRERGSFMSTRALHHAADARERHF